MSEPATLADPAMLDKIDKLFACNVGEYIDLPQLVVVGDQSSGKSSVLEGLTQLPFPRDSGLCTRFATQIIFRRNKELSVRTVTASIIPAGDSGADRASQLKEWSAGWKGGLEAEHFSQVMAEVHEKMGLSTSEGSSQSTFSKDVFRLEICGPEEDHLSVIDVPGIFKNTTPGLTSKADIHVVREMVEGYMKNPRSIMLTVVPANVDIATQEIIEMAREFDPGSERTIGVLTKPDLVDKGAEDKVLDLVEGKKLYLQHGWILVRNLNQQELQYGNVNRDLEEEAFGRKAPWSSIPPDRFGIKSLKNRLQETVTENARRTFPSVRSEITKRLRDSKNALKVLGGERETPEQQAGFLLDIVAKFQDITYQALSTNYGANNIFDRHRDLRLATIVVTRDTEFADDLNKWGHQYEFNIDDDFCPSSPSICEGETTKTRKVQNVAELEDVTAEQTQESLPSDDDDINQWLGDLYLNSRGFEIGTFNVSLLATSMKKQSKKWTNFARGYISDIITMVHKFIVKTLEIVSGDKRVYSSLVSIMMDDLLEKYRCALNHVDFLLHVERNGTPKTLNHYFNDNLQKCRQQRLTALLKKKGVENLSVTDIIMQDHMSNDEYTVQVIHDILESYYKVARKRFVDNVCVQAADYFLVTGPETPMKLFSPAFVNRLSPEKLAEIAGEEASVRRRRANLRKEIRELEEGRKMLI
ncbi:vacuolar sorting protein VPS1, dynamin [Aspergillus avenaceus]|uniref:Vacuolar sorting protein VPS1, dynamin n=1 Tax=Aspergillus avenaceus TaxID=36643 RepID=A0A5N6TMY0_ASPAV|nr:vacuolar sorting protein VPS1, dynamin [Aspergillus avenaceus]